MGQGQGAATGIGQGRCYGRDDARARSPSDGGENRPRCNGLVWRARVRADEDDVGPTVGQQLAAQVDQSMATGAEHSGPLEHKARGFVFGGEVTNAARQVRSHAQTHAQPAVTVARILKPRDPAKHVSSSLFLGKYLVVAAGTDLHETKHVARSSWGGRERVTHADRRSSHLAHENGYQDPWPRADVRKQNAMSRDHP